MFLPLPRGHLHVAHHGCCCCCSVTKSYLTLWDLMDCSMPDLPVAYHLSVCPSSCPLNRWCHPTISSSVAFSFCLHSFSASGSFPMSWLFASSGQNIEASSSASVLPKTIQGWFTLGLTGLISLVWSLWLQTLNCNSLLILNKPVFPREIPVSPFTCLSGQHFGGPCGDQRRSSKAPNIVSKQMWYPQLTPLSLLSHWP